MVMIYMYIIGAGYLNLSLDGNISHLLRLCFTQTPDSGECRRVSKNKISLNLHKNPYKSATDDLPNVFGFSH